MRVTIAPSAAHGTVAAPPSKSMAHRMLICAGLTHQSEPSVVRGLEPSQDVMATIDCLRVLGACVNRDYGGTLVYGIEPSVVNPNEVLPCRECGSTLRFFVPLCLLLDKPLTLTGSETLMSRPMSVYEEICANQGLSYTQDAQGIHVCGPLQPDTFKVAGNISSQFISGLLFALPLMHGTSTIELIPPVESRPYINMTLEALRLFGVKTTWLDQNTLFIPGDQEYQPRNIRVEGDFSNAAFLEALNYMAADANVCVTGLKENSLQGDSVYLQHFPALRAGTPTIDLGDCPDLGPVLMAVAAACNGATFTSCKRLAIKESNRGQAMAEELAKFGIAVRISTDQDTIVVEPGTLSTPTQVLNGHNDHRIVMALATLATITGGTIEGAQAVNKSFPSYFERLAKLGIDVTLEE